MVSMGPQSMGGRGGPVPNSAGGSERQHAADERLPGHRADDAVDRHRGYVRLDRLLEVADGLFRDRPEDAVDLRPLARVAGQVAELELLLYRAHRVALRATPDGD